MFVAQFSATDCQYAFGLVILDFQQAKCLTTLIGWKLDVQRTVKQVRQEQVGWPLVHCSVALTGRWFTAALGWHNIGQL
jgi:hypothetical protein